MLVFAYCREKMFACLCARLKLWPTADNVFVLVGCFIPAFRFGMASFVCTFSIIIIIIKKNQGTYAICRIRGKRRHQDVNGRDSNLSPPLPPLPPPPSPPCSPPLRTSPRLPSRFPPSTPRPAPPRHLGAPRRMVMTVKGAVMVFAFPAVRGCQLH